MIAVGAEFLAYFLRVERGRCQLGIARSNQVEGNPQLRWAVGDIFDQERTANLVWCKGNHVLGSLLTAPRAL
jgi:hypothetical protein